MSERFVYHRDGEIFTVGTDGFTLTNSEGVVTAQQHDSLPADVIADTIVQLVFAGWVAE